MSDVVHSAFENCRFTSCTTKGSRGFQTILKVIRARVAIESNAGPTATEQAFGAMVSLLKYDSKTRMVNDFKTPA